MKLFIFTTFLISTVFSNLALAGDCKHMNLVDAQKVATVIAQNRDKLLNNKNAPVKVKSVCINHKSGDSWSVAVNCTSSYCKPVDVGSFTLDSEGDQENYNLAKIANISESACTVATSESQEPHAATIGK